MFHNIDNGIRRKTNPTRRHARPEICTETYLIIRKFGTHEKLKGMKIFRSNRQINRKPWLGKNPKSESLLHVLPSW